MIELTSWDDEGVAGKVPSRGIPVKYEYDGQTFFAARAGLKKVEFDIKAFRSGRFREAYRGKVFFKPNRNKSWRQTLQCWDLRADKPFLPCIVKAFKRGNALYAAEWEKDLEVLKEAQYWGNEFNLTGMSKIHLEFADALLYEVLHRGSESFFFCQGLNLYSYAGVRVQTRERVFVEPFLEGTFLKANGNDGYVANLDDAHREFQEVAQAFSHWTWVASEKSLLVCDLQGVHETADEGMRWKFTDPAIHSAAGKTRFGQTDLGPRGINAFFRTHECNDFCKELPRPEVLIDIGFAPAASHTTFAFEYVRVSSEVHCQQHTASILKHEDAGTCYAHAIATVLRAAEQRIVGRQIEGHHSMVMRLIEKYGTSGAYGVEVLKAECPLMNLHYEESDASGAAEALNLGRALLLEFYLADDDWDEFTCFFRHNPCSILSSLSSPPNSKYGEGHAVVIIGHDNHCWYIKNSWGDDFADGGCFKMSKSLLSECHHRFFDVFWYQHELNQNDLHAYRRHCQNSNLHSM